VWSDHLTHLTRKHGKPDLLMSALPPPAAVTRLVAGSPATVTRELSGIVLESGINYLMLVFLLRRPCPDGPCARWTSSSGSHAALRLGREIGPDTITVPTEESLQPS